MLVFTEESDFVILNPNGHDVVGTLRRYDLPSINVPGGTITRAVVFADDERHIVFQADMPDADGALRDLVLGSLIVEVQTVG